MRLNVSYLDYNRHNILLARTPIALSFSGNGSVVRGWHLEGWNSATNVCRVFCRTIHRGLDQAPTEAHSSQGRCNSYADAIAWRGLCRVGDRCRYSDYVIPRGLFCLTGRSTPAAFQGPDKLPREGFRPADSTDRFCKHCHVGPLFQLSCPYFVAVDLSPLTKSQVAPGPSP